MFILKYINSDFQSFLFLFFKPPKARYNFYTNPTLARSEKHLETETEEVNHILLPIKIYKGRDIHTWDVYTQTQLG